MKPDLSLLQPLDVNLATRVNVGDSLSRGAAQFPSRAAIIDQGTSVSYGALNDAAERTAAALLDLGIEHQEPVAMVMSNSWQVLAVYYGCAKAGLVALPMNFLLAPTDQRWILADAGARIAVVSADLVPTLEEVLADAPGIETVIVVGDGPTQVAGRDTHDWQRLLDARDGHTVEVAVDDRDTVQCLYTSGTTSRPKGVLISHVSLQIALLSNAIIANHRWGHDWTVLLNVLPMFHTTALNTICMPTLTVGGTIVLPGPFNPDTVLDAIEQHRVTHVMMLPVMHGACLAAQRGRARDLSSVRTALYGMTPMPPSLLDQVDDLYPNAEVILGSGQTEVVPATVMQWTEHRHTAADSWGPSAPTVMTQIMDPDGAVLSADQTGEIVYRGPHVCSGYWNNPAANATAFAHGWFHSSDVGHLDEAGVVWFTDRLKDIIKSGGENVSSVSVESVVADAPGVAECAVIGLPDARWGEAVCAVVVPDGTVPAEDLEAGVIAYAKAHLAGFQVPKSVRTAQVLPKTATGKIIKHIVRENLNK
ncbi:AMP-binding protein [Leekyejoonella antrihumi]|uniref:AMP-binding protein n=1 Tax=Leekyejoonella antrihumi TaxID=1660198 RepID=A0A563DUM3_9MICO|nr:AMP-binding protein [Leekyejoonella antrihumi]TWP33958.1 AMP-binding protein [Leekyejoonella antrihumi]